MPTVQREFGTLYVREAGRGNEPVILLHEYFGTHRSWDAQIAPLARYFRVFAPDLRGHGRSPLHRNDRITVTSIADDVRAIQEQFGVGACHLVGCSLGAVVAMNLARAEPASLRSLTVTGVPLMGSDPAMAYGRYYVEQIFPRIEPSLDRLHGGPEPGYARELLLRNFARDLEERPEDHSESTARGDEIAVPTLIASGENDPVFPPSMALALWERMPDASLAVLPACGHLVHQEMPGVFNSLLIDHLLRSGRGPESG